jgi:hypothetical protein
MSFTLCAPPKGEGQTGSHGTQGELTHADDIHLFPCIDGVSDGHSAGERNAGLPSVGLIRRRTRDRCVGRPCIDAPVVRRLGKHFRLVGVVHRDSKDDPCLVQELHAGQGFSIEVIA